MDFLALDIQKILEKKAEAAGKPLEEFIAELNVKIASGELTWTEFFKLEEIS